MLFHAGAALALALLPPQAPPAAPEQQVALVWTEQGAGAGDAADSADTGVADAMAQPEPRQPDAAPPAPAEAAPADVIEPAPQPRLKVPAPQQPADVAGEAAEHAVQAELPLPPPPAPRRPVRNATAAPEASRPAAPAAAPSPSATGGVEALGAVTPPRQLAGASNPPPSYPTASRLRNEQGQVTLRVEIDANGAVVDIAVQASAGFPALDRAAIQAVRGWRFEPARRDGQPVLSVTRIGITFQLEGGPRW